MIERDSVEHEPWPLRATLLLVLGAIFGLIVHFLVGTDTPWTLTRDPLRVAAAAFVVCGGIVGAFSLEKIRWQWAIAFAAAGGLILALITYWNGDPYHWGSGEDWRFSASLLSIAIAVPLFQAMRDAGSRHLDVNAVHEHVWTNVILWFLALAFLVATWLLAYLLGQLFELIGLHFLQKLLGKAWFASMLTGGVLGAVIGMLRDRDRVLGLLQRVARTILSVLTPVLAIGLAVFVLALPFTGLKPLWDQTNATTPILLCCVVGAFVLANAVIGNAPAEEGKARILRWAAMILGATMLPIAIVAAVSMGKRIGQYGFTPDRLWSMVIVAVAVAVAAVYLFALIRGRLAWAPMIRRSNVALAAGICILALFLALPIVNFGALSARDQLGLLESGKIGPDRFDWRAMRFDFGPSGVRALERLRDKGRTPEIKALAEGALHSTDRWSMPDPGDGVRDRQAFAALRILPRQVELPAPLRQRIGGQNSCAERGLCILLYQPGASNAVLVMPSECAGAPSDSYLLRSNCAPDVSIFYETNGQWSSSPPPLIDESAEPSGEDIKAREAQARADRAALDHNQVEIRTVPRRQVFVGGRPAGEPFE
jgi:hypothetical protein